MFIDEKKYIEIEIYYRPTKSGNSLKVEVDSSKISEEEKGQYTKVVFKMKQMTWKQYNSLLKSAKTVNSLTMAEDTDWATYREKKLLNLLAEWDAKDKDGSAIPLSDKKILSLHPMIAETLLNEYDKKVYLDEEEQKN